MPHDVFISYEHIHQLVEKLYKKIQSDEWIPDYIVAIASGGLIPSRILKTYLNKDILVVGLKRYDDNQAVEVIPQKIQWIDEVEKKITDKKILLIDEVDDTRVTLSYCLLELAKHHPEEIRVAVLHQKDKKKEAKYPDFLTHVYTGEIIGDEWIHYPWEAKDIISHNSHISS